MLETSRPLVTIVVATLCSLPTSACAPDEGPSDRKGAEDDGGPATAGPVPAERCDELAATLGSSGATAGDVCRVTFPGPIWR